MPTTAEWKVVRVHADHPAWNAIDDDDWSGHTFANWLSKLKGTTVVIWPPPDYGDRLGRFLMALLNAGAERIVAGETYPPEPGNFCKSCFPLAYDIDWSLKEMRDTLKRLADAAEAGLVRSRGANAMSADEALLLPRFCERTGNPCGTDTVHNDEPGCSCRQCMLWCREELKRRWLAMDSQRTEAEKLRIALADCANNAAGFRCTSGMCSTEFLLNVPEEVRLQIGARERDRDANKAAVVRVEAERDALRAEFSEAVQDIPVRGGETFGRAVQRVVSERDRGYEFLRRWQEFATQAMRRLGEVDEETFPDDTATRAALLELVELMGLDTPWPLAAVLKQLCDAADHLLRDHDCDAHGWELVGSARDAGRSILQRLTGGRPT